MNSTHDDHITERHPQELTPAPPAPQWQSAAPTPPQSGPLPYPGTPAGPPSGPIPPQGYGRAYTPPPPTGYAPQPGYGYAVGPNGQPTAPYMPPPPHYYRPDMRTGLNKGNSALARLIRKGVSGQLIPVAAFQNLRMRSPVALTVAVLITGMAITYVINQSIGLKLLIPGQLLGEATWLLTAFVLIAIGTRGSLLTVVYGIGLFGVVGHSVIAFIAIGRWATFSDEFFISPHADLATTMLVMGLFGMTAAVLHGYIGIQVNREIKKIASGR